MSSYAEFSIQGVYPDLSKKQVVIETNFKVDPNSVSLKTVSYYNYDEKKLETYKLRVDGKNIYIELSDYPTNESRYYLKVAGIKDALGRKLLTNYDDYIKFINDVVTKVEIISPISRETIKSRDVLIAIKATEVIDNIYYRIEIGIDNLFFNNIATITCRNRSVSLDSEEIVISEENIYSDGVSLQTTIDREGQLYIRARAELDEQTVGEWSEVSSFNIYTISMDSIDTTFLEDYLTTEDLFDESVDLLETEVTDKNPNATLNDYFYLEFNKQIVLSEELEPNDDGLIELGNVTGRRKNIDGTGRDRVKFKLMVEEEDYSSIILMPSNDDIQTDSIYTFNLKDLEFEDGTFYSNKETFITMPSDNYWVSLDDVKDHMRSLKVDDISIISHIIDSCKTAKYWAKYKISNINDMPDFNMETIQNDYYPFYMFIKYHAIVESLKEFYMEMVTHPYKWRDMISDLEREEQWDLGAIKALIDDYEKEAEEWLELVVTITADPQWALRGKYCYSVYNTYSNPFHRIHWGLPPHNTDYNRGY